MNTAYWVPLMPRQQGDLHVVSYLSCPTSSIAPLHLGWPGSFNSSCGWTFKNDLDLLHYASSDPVFQFRVNLLCFCPWFLPWAMTLVTSPVRFPTLSSNLWLSLGDGPSNASEVIIILMLLEADLSYVTSVQSCIVVDVRPSSHLTNTGHLSPKGLNINMWMETSEFIIIPRKTIL